MFKYVFIPANLNDAIEERTLAIPEGKDVEVALDAFKRHFRKAGGEQSEAQRDVQRQMLVKQLGDAAANINPEMLNGALDMQMVENIALLSNSPETGFVGVNMYTDDQAQLKGLETNLRASQIAQCAGKLIEVKGDAFMARVFDNEDEFRRMDFTLQEVSSSADWVQQAADIARRKQQQDGGMREQKDFLERLKKKQHSPGFVPPKVQELTPAEVEKEEGNASFKKGDWEGAIARYSKALELDPGLVPALNNRALSSIKLGLYSQADSDCSLVLEKEPRNVKAFLRRAVAREHLGESGRSGALEDLEAALRLEPGNKDAQAHRLRLLGDGKP